MNKKTKWDLEKAIELKNKGYRYAEIARELNVKSITIQTYFLKHFGRLETITNEAKNNELTFEQKQVLFGGLLGDANLTLQHKNAWGKIEHSKAQELYVLHKKEKLFNLTNNVKYLERFDKRTFKIYYSCKFELLSNPALNEFYHLFYKDKIKIIPDDLSLLTPLAIAIWYMDDGTKELSGYSFSAMCFSLTDIKKLSEKLLDYDIETTIRKSGTLYVKNNSAKIFKNLIQEFVIDSMKYKL